MIRIHSFVFNEFSENTYVVWDESLEAVIIDPGCYTPAEQSELVEFITLNALRPKKVLNTHCHIDHILGNKFLCDRYKIDVNLNRDELITYKQASEWASMFGLRIDSIPEKIQFIDQGDSIRFGNSTLDVAFTPGHSIASLTFFNLDEKIAFPGDVIFNESIGRTDLPGGNHNRLIRSIKEQLLIWNDDINLYPGHGSRTTIGHERKFNPFLN